MQRLDRVSAHKLLSAMPEIHGCLDISFRPLQKENKHWIGIQTTKDLQSQAIWSSIFVCVYKFVMCSSCNNRYLPF